jgi:hypothetical protein
MNIHIDVTRKTLTAKNYYTGRHSKPWNNKVITLLMMQQTLIITLLCCATTLVPISRYWPTRWYCGLWKMVPGHIWLMQYLISWYSSDISFLLSHRTVDKSGHFVAQTLIQAIFFWVSWRTWFNNESLIQITLHSSLWGSKQEGRP